MMKAAHTDDAILMVETETLVSTFRSVDAALKAVPVDLTSWRLGRGMAGRGVFALRGEHANLEAAEEAVVEAAGVGLRECQLIPRPDPLGFWSEPFGQGAS
jgi:microcompartment protein CcmL/EutN